MNATNKVSSKIDQKDDFSDNADRYTLLTKPLEELTVMTTDPVFYLEQYAKLPSPSRELFYASQVRMEMESDVRATYIFKESVALYFPEAIDGLLLIGMTKTALVLEAMALTLGEQYPRDSDERIDLFYNYMDDHEMAFTALAERAVTLFNEEKGGFEVCASRYAETWLNNKAYMKSLSQFIEKSRMARPLHIRMLYASAGPLFAVYGGLHGVFYNPYETRKYLAKVPKPLQPIFFCTVSLHMMMDSADLFERPFGNSAPETLKVLKLLGLNDLANQFEAIMQFISQPYEIDDKTRFEKIQTLDKETQFELRLMCHKFKYALETMMPQYDQLLDQMCIKIFKDNPQHYPGVEARTEMK